MSSNLASMPDGLKKGGMVKAGGPKTAVMPPAAALCWWATTCASHLKKNSPPVQEGRETKANSSCLREREHDYHDLALSVCQLMYANVAVLILGRDCS
jgi:hypothetical protein